MHKLTFALGAAAAASIVAAAPSAPAHALPLSAPAGLSADARNTEPAQNVHYYGYRRYYRPYYGYRPYRPYYGYRPYYRPYGYSAYAYYRPYRPYWGWAWRGRYW